MANYGVGGQYEPHFDFGRVSPFFSSEQMNTTMHCLLVSFRLQIMEWADSMNLTLTLHGQVTHWSRKAVISPLFCQKPVLVHMCPSFVVEWRQCALDWLGGCAGSRIRLYMCPPFSCTYFVQYVKSPYESRWATIQIFFKVELQPDMLLEVYVCVL